MLRLSPLAVIVAVSLMVSACGGKKNDHGVQPLDVTVANPLSRNVVEWDDFVGQFIAVDSVDVRPRVSGYLQEVAFKDGQTVRKGQLLFVIDPRPYQAALDQAKGQAAHAQAAMANAKTELDRGKKLLDAKAISEQAYDTLVATDRQAQADLVAAEAAVRTAALNLEFTRVTAPLGGRISDRRVAPGNLVAADTTVLTNIVDLNPIRFSFTGSEALYLKYSRANEAGTRTSSRDAANPVEIRLQDEPNYRWKGHMEFVDNALDNSSGTIRGRAVVDNPDGFLTPGMFGHMRLLGSGAYNALLLPDQAVVTDQTRQVIYVVDGGGVVSQRPVELGPLSGGLRVIKSGVGPNDRVIIDGMQRARPGQKVNAKPGSIPVSASASGQGGLITPPAGSATIVDAGR
ncbi:efflux RND transporter periplasmic adaptor subunit [Phenylobacterium montanum]|uniref:Efflux RND transporter periplasmic adaptor subunit n=1 Tax=Phenylobacterium montanum TaxID=2823693 RepID=A0A975G046_9CAUL|nr:efflux RND transporter periplasmic adaptor subunit [Caulobacter sp. S6]QUD88073.1 efflux RND transporter periplasmic adaptor subunit [Caulobacter sp. S6]